MKQFAPRSSVTARVFQKPRGDYAPPIMVPKDDKEALILEATLSWHKARIDLKEDGKRHCEMVRRIGIVLKSWVMDRTGDYYG